MPTISDLKETREKKFIALKQSGCDPYPAIVEKDCEIGKARSSDGQDVKVVGRITAIRGHGKIFFIDIQDESGKLQGVFKADAIPASSYALLEQIDLGDFLAVQGSVGKTQAGEVSIFVRDFQIIAKSFRPLPDQWYGLKDKEERYRKRYLDLLMNPDVKKVFETRSKIIRSVREFFDEKGFLEVETPTLQPLYGGANARPFETHHHALDIDLFLKISDELYLKRLIIGGFEKVYEIDKDFRNEGIDKSHNPEFTMMECYWAYANYQDMMKLTEELYEHVARTVLGTTTIEYQGVQIELKAPWKRMTMTDALKELGGIDVKTMSDEDLLALIKQHGLVYEGNPQLTGVGEGFKRGIAIATLFEIVEPKLIQPTFITDFPKETTALCKQKASDPALIERFEPYINGWEIGNAYSELNNPIIQKEFFEEQQKAKASGDAEAHPMDTDFIEAMEYGMPPTGGLGLGIDRMVMFLTNQPTIRDVLLFPTMKPEKG